MTLPGPLTVGSLFAGIGGFDLGFERAGMKVVWQVEIDEYCRRVLERHFPKADRSVTDVRLAGASNLARVDVLCGGFPCQDISRAGLLAGIDGERSGLWAEMFRIVCELRPQYVVVENVAALLDGGVSRVLGDLAEGGYDAEWDCIPAAAIGAAHIRDRVFILAHAGRFPGAFKVLGFDGCDELVQQGGNGQAPERGTHRKLIALVPGVHPGAFEDRWRAQSRVDRSINDFPGRLDRLKGLGNSVVPAIAEWIGGRLVEASRANFHGGTGLSGSAEQSPPNDSEAAEAR